MSTAVKTAMTRHRDSFLEAMHARAHGKLESVKTRPTFPAFLDGKRRHVERTCERCAKTYAVECVAARAVVLLAALLPFLAQRELRIRRKISDGMHSAYAAEGRDDEAVNRSNASST